MSSRKDLELYLHNTLAPAWGINLSKARETDKEALPIPRDEAWAGVVRKMGESYLYFSDKLPGPLNHLIG